ncbi:MAG: hypothetical protein PF447_09630 [Spirochaetaceae bacterium]|nr:hypothetical protein [Spirochaetaceae bacterium]
MAARALEMGVNNQGKDVEEETQLRLLRLKSMEVMIENQASMDDILSYIEIIYRNTDVLEEKLTSLLVLSANGSDDAFSLLVDFLDIFIERKLGGINPNNEEQQIILQILFSLGDSGNAALAMPALSQIEIYDYSNSINRTAKLAMENYQ